ncbi:MAG: formate/nitrite transporter family protein [Pseudolabrys sp.]
MPEAPELHAGVDALVPAEIARKAETVGAEKVRMDFWRLMVLAILAGAFIGLGAMFATTVMSGAGDTVPYGVSRLLGGLVFCLGLVLVVLGGAELFTGNMLMTMALASGKVRMAEMLRAWAIIYVGNFIGAVGLAGLVFLSGQYEFGGGSVARAALDIATAKVALSFMQALLLGVLCNLLVCLAVWLALGARSAADKVLAVLFPVSAFVAAGFEHSVANMYFVPLGLFIAAAQSLDLPGLTWGAFALSLIPVTIGNIIGGAVLVGVVYWFVYLRGREA